jgi:hypothetical protein
VAIEAVATAITNNLEITDLVRLTLRPISLSYGKSYLFANIYKQKQVVTHLFDFTKLAFRLGLANLRARG